MALPKRWRFAASLRLAVTVIIGLAILSAAGTIVEARFNDAEVAQKLVYQSWWMYLVLGLLCLNLTGVMVDRWPWKRHHVGFVSAHIGIILLLFGSWLTHKYGVDGSLAIPIGESGNDVVIPQRDLMIFASLDGNTMKGIYESPVDFLLNPPTEKKPFVVNLGQDSMRFTEYFHFAFRDTEVKASESAKDGPGVRIQLENPNVNVTQWLLKNRLRDRQELDLGPAKVVLADQEVQPSSRNEIILVPQAGKTKMRYWIYGKDQKLRKKGEIDQAETIDTGWMGMKFRLLRYLPNAVEETRFIKASAATPVTTSAVKFSFKGKEHWVGLDTTLPVFLEDRAYLITFRRRSLRLNFPLQLKKFTMQKNPGTETAATYESEVEVPGLNGPIVISMNEPLHHNGFTFYQSSFDSNEQGEPTLSVFSVNRDPGRWIKYLGSLLIVLGSIMLFYFKRGILKKSVNRSAP